MRPVVVIVVLFALGLIALSVFGFLSYASQPAREITGFSIPDDGLRCDVDSQGDVTLAIRISPLRGSTWLLDAKPPSSAPWARDGIAAIKVTSSDFAEASTLAEDLPPAAEGFEGVGVEGRADVVMRLVPNEVGAPIPSIRLYWTRGEPIYAQTIDAADIEDACVS